MFPRDTLVITVDNWKQTKVGSEIVCNKKVIVLIIGQLKKKKLVTKFVPTVNFVCSFLQQKRKGFSKIIIILLQRKTKLTQKAGHNFAHPLDSKQTIY